MNKFKHTGVWCCSNKGQCTWKGFVLNRGISWGTITPAWKRWHDRECEGNLIQLLQPVTDVPVSYDEYSREDLMALLIETENEMLFWRRECNKLSKDYDEITKALVNNLSVICSVMKKEE